MTSIQGFKANILSIHSRPVAIATCSRHALRMGNFSAAPFAWTRTISRVNSSETPPSDPAVSQTALRSLDSAVPAVETRDGMAKSTVHEGRPVFVGGLAPCTDELSLRQTFERFGKLVSVRLVRTIDGESRRFAFLGFASVDVAQELADIAQERPFFLDGRRLNVTLSNALKRPPRLRNISVDNIPLHASGNDILRVFKDYGAVHVKQLMSRPPHRREFIGTALVEFRSQQHAQRAVTDAALHRFEMDGHQLKVVPAGWAEKGLYPPSNTLNVRNIPSRTGESVLVRLFEKLGAVKDVRFAHSIWTGGRKGYAFVEFFSLETSRRILEAHEQNPFTIRGVVLEIDYALPFIPSLYTRHGQFHRSARDSLRSASYGTVP